MAVCDGFAVPAPAAAPTPRSSSLGADIAAAGLALRCCLSSMPPDGLDVLVVVTWTVGMELTINALNHSPGGPLFVVTIVLTACYFVFFGGILGQHARGYLTGLGPQSCPTALNLRAVVQRTRRSICQRLVPHRARRRMDRTKEPFAAGTGFWLTRRISERKSACGPSEAPEGSAAKRRRRARASGGGAPRA